MERASARETAARVALGAVCKAFLARLDIFLVSHVVRIGKVATRAGTKPPEASDLGAVDASPVRCHDPATSRRMVDEVKRVQKARDTLGGVFEVLAYGVPVGLGSYVQHDRRLDARLALALMSIQSVKGVEIGDGFASAARLGSRAHDEIERAGSALRRPTDAGGFVPQRPAARPAVDLDAKATEEGDANRRRHATRE